MSSRMSPMIVASVLVAGALSTLLLPRRAGAHCDTLDGPVVADARAALGKGEVSPVLKWVKIEYEPEIRAAFKKAVAVRGQGPQAQEVADMYFFETLVRLHRAGEGEPYTGLKPAGTDPGPAVKLGDQALETGSVDELVKLVTAQVETGVRGRFAQALHARKAAAEDADNLMAGRASVAAYVEFVHYVEGLYSAAGAVHAHHGEAGAEHGHDPAEREEKR